VVVHLSGVYYITTVVFQALCHIVNILILEDLIRPEVLLFHLMGPATAAAGAGVGGTTRAGVGATSTSAPTTSAAATNPYSTEDAILTGNHYRITRRQWPQLNDITVRCSRT
jgi:hypothetical protein